MDTFPKEIYRFNALFIKIPAQYFIESEKTISKFIWNNKRPRIVITILNSKGSSGVISILDLKQYYRTIVLKKTHGIGMDSQVDQWNRIEDPEMNTKAYDHLNFDKGAKTIQ